MDPASVPLALAINIFFRRSFAFRCDSAQILLLAGLSVAGAAVVPLFAAALAALAFAKAAFPSQLSGVSLLLPNWDKQVTWTVTVDSKSSQSLTFDETQDILNFVLTFLFVDTARGREWDDAKLHSLWTAVPILSVFQLCRNPVGQVVINTYPP